MNCELNYRFARRVSESRRGNDSFQILATGMPAPEHCESAESTTESPNPETTSASSRQGVTFAVFISLLQQIRALTSSCMLDAFTVAHHGKSIVEAAYTINHFGQQQVSQTAIHRPPGDLSV